MISDAIEIVPLPRPPDAAVRVPGSKSITNRALLLASLARGTSVISGALYSDDTEYMAESLRRLGIGVREDAPGERFEVVGQGGLVPAGAASLFVGNAGTAARFLVAYACLGMSGRYVVDGNARMRERPIGDLIDALRQLGGRISSPTGCLPATVDAGGLAGGRARVRGGRSSQYLSALLMVAPYARSDVELEVADDLIAKPYVDMTLAMMGQFGVKVDRHGYRRFSIRHGQCYEARRYAVEADASSAHYFLAAAALTSGRVRVDGIGSASLQGDARFADVLEAMGAGVERQDGALSVRGSGGLRGIDVDMNDISDTSMTLAVLAPFADGPVRIRGVAHIRHQESDRIAAVSAELRKLGGTVREHQDGWEILPSGLHGGEVDTYGDHRLAMAFALVGLRIPGIRIRDPGCVAKTFPDYFARLEGLRA